MGIEPVHQYEEGLELSATFHNGIEAARAHTRGPRKQAAKEAYVAIIDISSTESVGAKQTKT